MKNFTYGDLKAGMRVELRNGTIGVLIPVCEGFVMVADKPMATWDRLNTLEYNDDLTHKKSLLLISSTEMDVMKVYDISNQCGPVCILTDKRFLGDPIWTREETKEMTVEEISKALGYEVKIVK